MAYIPFPIDEVIDAIKDRLWAYRDRFSPNLMAVDLDEFWGAESEVDEVPIPGIILEPLGGDLAAVGGGQASDDTHKIRASIFSDVPASRQDRPSSLVLLRQLVQVIRDEGFLSGLVVNVAGCQIQEIIPGNYEPNNSFFQCNISGWGLVLEVRVLCQEVYSALPIHEPEPEPEPEPETDPEEDP